MIPVARNSPPAGLIVKNTGAPGIPRAVRSKVIEIAYGLCRAGTRTATRHQCPMMLSDNGSDAHRWTNPAETGSDDTLSTWNWRYMIKTLLMWDFPRHARRASI